jgi:hypothetical protein
MTHKIIDNFLDKQDFIKIKNIIYNTSSFPWYCSHYHVASKLTKGDGSCFYHTLFDNKKSVSFFSGLILKTIFKNIKHKEIIRAKVNLYPGTSKIKEHGMHVDQNFKHKGIILYVNNNDGYTKLIDGTKIESIENRALFFDSSKKHCSTTCTNAESRINININYK